MARRNNPERLGAAFPDSPELPETQQLDSLSFVVPTEFVALPSRGLFYGEGHPLYLQESIEIKYMTAKEEDLLSSKGLIEKGLVLDRLIQNLLVDNKIQSRDLLICDRNAILIASRASGFGHEYLTNITCRRCTQTETYEYDLHDAIFTGPISPAELAELDVEHVEDEMFKVKIPNSSTDVVIRLLNGHDEKVVLDLGDKKKKKHLEDQLVTNQLSLMIVSVMGHTESTLITKYIESLPLRDSRFLRNIYDKISPSIELRKEFVCNECGYEDDIIFPFTVDFFWPDARI